MIFDPLYFLLLAPGLLLAMWAQFKVKSAYHQAAGVPVRSGLSGAEAARIILDEAGLRNARIEMGQGMLSDHYDPRSKTLRLSRDVYAGRSAASLGIAAHEAGHALQDAQGYAPLKIRNGIVPLAAFGGNTAMLLFIIGLVLGGAGNVLGTWLVYGAIGLYSAVVLFQLVNLPVEFDASNRAKRVLMERAMVTGGDETRLVNKVLNAAALTYVAATLTAILTLLYFVLRASQSRQ